MNELESPPCDPPQVTSVPPQLPLDVRFRRYLRQLAVRVVIYMLAYLLIAIVTIGPCFWAWFEATYVNGPLWIQKFYAPLLWLCDHCPPLSWLVNLYINWWIR